MHHYIQQEYEQSHTRFYNLFCSTSPLHSLRFSTRLSASPLRPKLHQLSLDLLLQPALQLGPIPDRKQALEPHEHGCEQECLHQVVQQRRRPAFEFAMTDELRDPRGDVQHDGVGVHGVRGGPRRQLRAHRAAANDQWRDEAPRDGLEENVGRGVDEGCDDAEVRRKVGEAERGRDRKKGACVGALAVSVRGSHNKGGMRKGRTSMIAVPRISGTKVWCIRMLV
jgi:hypothetical protein